MTLSAQYKRTASPSPFHSIPRFVFFVFPSQLHPALAFVSIATKIPFFTRPLYRAFFGSSPATSKAAEDTVAKIIADNKAVVFSKSYCPFCSEAKRTLTQLNAKFAAVELNERDDGADLQQALKDLNGQSTVPNIYINRNHVGGNSDLQGLQNRGVLQTLLAKAGALE